MPPSYSKLTSLLLLSQATLLSYSSISPFSLNSDLTLFPVGALNVHIVPHSHMELGYIKSTDDYYSEYVKHIFPSVFMELQNDPAKTFTCSEVFYFHKWYKDQD